MNNAEHLSHQAKLQLSHNDLTEQEGPTNDFTSEEEQLISEDTEPDGFNPDEFFAKRGGDGGIDYKNRQYLNYKPGMNQMPPGLKTQTAQEILRDIRNTGANYSWNNEAQMKCFNKNAYGICYNINDRVAAAGMETGPQYIWVLLSPDATATTAYEEYLHVMEALARGNMPTTLPAENFAEEIRVEYQVMQNAQRLGTSSQEWQLLSRNRHYYIAKLVKELGGQIPDGLKPYLNDPPKPFAIS
jgi:hypothetical protein